MKTFISFLFIVLLTFTIISAQTVLWSYKANGSLWMHIRSIKNIDDNAYPDILVGTRDGWINVGNIS